MAKVLQNNKVSDDGVSKPQVIVINAQQIIDFLLSSNKWNLKNYPTTVK